MVSNTGASANDDHRSNREWHQDPPTPKPVDPAVFEDYIELEDHDADHDGVDDRRNPSCAGCARPRAFTPAFVYCCECGMALCFRCDSRLHASDALSLDPYGKPMRSHRVERIVEGGGVALLSPLLELGVVVVAFGAVRLMLSAATRMLSVDYFFESVCPVVSRLRFAVFRIDHALYPIMRGILGTWCDTEDAFIKIFIDVWVRGILTSTDSFALLVMKTPSALAALLVILASASLLAIPYAAIATTIRGIELCFIPDWGICRFLAAAVQMVNVVIWAPFRAVAFLARCTILGLVMDADFYRVDRHQRYLLPPKTGRRLVRDGDGNLGCQHGLVSHVVAGLSSVTRIFVHYHMVARRAIVDAILTAVFVAAAVRIILLSTPRCGWGVLSAFALPEEGFVETEHLAKGAAPLFNLKEVHPQLKSDIVHSETTMCHSLPALLRRWAERAGVEIPKLADMGGDATLLANLQDSTSDDYIDETLRAIARRGIGQFGHYSLWVRLSVAVLIVVTCFAGAIRRILNWADIQRRFRLLQLRSYPSEGIAHTRERYS